MGPDRTMEKESCQKSGKIVRGGLTRGSMPIAVKIGEPQLARREGASETPLTALDLQAKE